MNRRGFLTGALSLVGAPAIVRVASIMPVKAAPEYLTLDQYLDLLLRPTVARLAEQIANDLMRPVGPFPALPISAEAAYKSALPSWRALNQ